ncbi:MAG TPA: glutamate--tRNA ligase [bacterium]|nr:glutamate--tRNA ligase [bacterium]
MCYPGIMTVRTRYAPSPTGYLHVGGAWMAFFNWLFARHSRGEFVIRIEDTDRSRSTEEFEAAIIQDLRWLGLDWDEGPDVGGAAGPYRQTERTALYRAHAEDLVARGAAYPCYCTREELEADRERAVAEHRAYRYVGRCRGLSPADRRQRETEGRVSTLRFRIPDGHPPIVVQDLVLGRIEFAPADLDDFIIQRSDGTPLYNFANVVDDHGMQITDIVRGSEHLSNTPRQFLIYEAYAWQVPRVAHLPVLLGIDRKKLSKRHGDTSVRDYAAQGYLPEALVNFFALMGWYPEDGRELFTPRELVERFRIEEMGKSGAVFDIQKLNWMNGVYMQAAIREAPDRVIDLVIACLRDDHLLDGEVGPATRAYVGRVVEILGERLRLPKDVVVYGDFFFREVAYDPQAVSKHLGAPGAADLLRRARETFAALDPWNLSTIEAGVRGVAERLGIPAKAVIHPLRVALTGKTVGPGLFELIDVLGKQRVLERLDRAVELVGVSDAPASGS